MSYLTHSEKNTAVDLLTAGYKKAAVSFSTMTKQKVGIKPSRIEISNDSVRILKNLKKDKELILMTTGVIGEHSGKSYLLFNEKEADEVYKACMPYNTEEASRMMEMEALLKELDNILSAAVITEFSNFLDIMVFGDVPVLSRLNQTALKVKMTEEFQFGEGKNIEHFMVADTQFVFDNDTKLCPQFIWKLDEGFIAGIRHADLTNKNIV